MKFPTLGPLTVSVPGGAIESISVGADWIHTAVANPEAVRFSMSVIEGDGRVIADAFILLEQAALRWEGLWVELEQSK